MPELPKQPSVETKKEPEQQPCLENLREGTWAYMVGTYNKGESTRLWETNVAHLNGVLSLIDKQGGRVVNTMGFDVKGRETVIIIVEKPQSKG